MNKHINKHKPAKKVAQNLGICEVDHLPVEVAEAMLFSQGTKLTNRMKKNCLAARDTLFESTLQPKGFELKFAEKAKRASAAQLLKWAKRTIASRARVNKAYLRLRVQRSQIDPLKVHDISMVERAMSACDIEADALDKWMSNLRSEATKRLIVGDVFNPVRDADAQRSQT